MAAAAGVGPTPEAPAELVTDKGYHGRDALRDLEDSPWKTRISEPKRRELLRWRGDDRTNRLPSANWEGVLVQFTTCVKSRPTSPGWG